MCLLYKVVVIRLIQKNYNSFFSKGRTQKQWVPVTHMKRTHLRFHVHILCVLLFSCCCCCCCFRLFVGLFAFPPGGGALLLLDQQLLRRQRLAAVTATAVRVPTKNDDRSIVLDDRTNPRQILFRDLLKELTPVPVSSSSP